MEETKTQDPKAQDTKKLIEAMTGRKPREREKDKNREVKEITIFLADDHRLFREGLKTLLENQPMIKVIGEAGAPGGAAASGLRKAPKRERKDGGAAAAGASEDLISPLQGTVLKVAVDQGAEVAEGDLVCVIEAMKMENEITAHRGGKVSELPISDGAAVSSGDLVAGIPPKGMGEPFIGKIPAQGNTVCVPKGGTEWAWNVGKQTYREILIELKNT